VVDAAAEGQVRAGALAAEVEVGGGGAPVLLVAVGRAEQREDQLAGRHRLARQLHLAGHDAARELHRAVVAQQLVHRGGVERRVGGQALELVAVAQQRQRAVADEVDRGLVAGQVEQQHLVQQLVTREPVAVLLRRDQGGQHVVGRVGPLPVDGGLDVGGHALARLHDGREVGGVDERLQ
jgi:hypothetical protein